MEPYYRMKSGVLAKLLEENDITQTEFAELVDIPHSMISCYGRGKKNVPESRIKKIAEQFGLRIEDIADAVACRRAPAPFPRPEVLLPGLRRCRLDAGLSQRALAAKAGVAPASIVAWEANNRCATIAKAKLLCKTLGVQLSDLTRADEKSAEPHTGAANMSLSELSSALVNAAATVKAENERLKATQEKWVDEVATVKAENEWLKATQQKGVDEVAILRSENERLKAAQRKWEEAFKVLGLAPIK